MLTFEQLKEGVEYIAIGSNGKEYSASYVNNYFPGGVVFCVRPDGVDLIGFKEVKSAWLPEGSHTIDRGIGEQPLPLTASIPHWQEGEQE